MSKQQVDVAKEARVISLGEKARNLLEDEAFLHATKMLEKEYWERFKREALTTESRAILQAQARVLDDVKASLQVLVDSGFTAASNRDKRERSEQKTP